jgi:spermidine/putrescine transport system permease protein
VAGSILARERRLGWGLVAPALLWTLAFFVLPFLAMLTLSFAHMEGRTIVAGFAPAITCGPSPTGRWSRRW